MRTIHALPAIAALVGVTAVGCQSVSPLKPGVETPSYALAEQNTAGRVVVRIKWPQTVQALPSATKAVVLKTYRKGQLVSTETLVREDGQALGIKTLRLPAASDYFMEAMAYDTTAPSEQSVPLAMGESNFFDIGSNTLTPVAISLNALGPVAASGGMDVAPLTIGGAGLMIPVRVLQGGDYNELSESDSIEVWFGNAKSPEVTRSASDKTKRSFWAKVPANVSGVQDLKVKVNGVMADTGADFTVLNKLSSVLKDYSVDADSSLSMSTFVYGHALDNSHQGATIPYPALSWKSSDPSVAFASQSGQVYGLKAGKATITAFSGSLSTSFTVTVNARQGNAELEVNVPSSGAGSANMSVDLPAYGGNGTGTVQH